MKSDDASLRDAVQKLTLTEDKSKPLTDDAIARFLKKSGFEVGRLKVSAIRRELGIPISRKRRDQGNP